MTYSSLVFALAYQIPALVFGLLLKQLVRHPLLQAVLLLPGTLVHELLHLVVGAVLNARPVSLSLWPRQVGGGQWIVGSVGFSNVRWYNAVFVGLAPLLAIALVVWFAPPAVGWTVQRADVQRWLLATPILTMCLPSAMDLKLALRSWPLLCAVAALLVFRYY